MYPPIYHDVDQFLAYVASIKKHIRDGEDSYPEIFFDLDPVEDHEIMDLVSGFATAPAIQVDGHVSTALSANFKTSRQVVDFLKKERNDNNDIYFYLFMSKYDKLLLRYHRIPKPKMISGIIK